MTKIIKFTNGTHKFWVIDEKKIKFWTKMAAMTQSTVKKLKEKEID